MTTYEVDERTGLPRLPNEKFFWRVASGAFSIDRLYLCKQTWYGSKCLHQRVLHYYDVSRNVLDPKTEIYRAAVSIMNEFVDPWEKYRGDYPPKSLAGV